MNRFTLFTALALAVICPFAAAADEKYSPEELEEIVAPIALYPDVVLSSMLPASTAPTDVVAAARGFVRGHFLDFEVLG